MPDAPPPAAPPPLPGWPARGGLSPETLLRVAVVGLAAFLRLFWLAQRPPHFDEGVNGWFTDQMQTTGFYKYDPSNYHGPLHFYVLFLFKCLLGRNLWALRLPVAIVGIVTVDWIFRFRAFFGRRACAWAALAMALSPGTVFFHRDAIHETWLVFFLVLAFWGVCGLWQLGEKRYLWGLVLGVTGTILTKETYLVHFACFFVAVPLLWILEDYLPSARRPLLAPPAPPPGPDEGAKSLWGVDAVEPPRETTRFFATCAPQQYRPSDVWTALAVGLGLIVFFYSGNFYHWSGLGGLVSTFQFWGKKAHEGEGHNKPFIYWTTLLLQNEPVAALGLLACLRYAVPPLSTARYRALGGATVGLCLLWTAFWFVPGDKHLDAARDALRLGDATLLGQPLTLLPTALAVLTVVLLAGATSCLALPRAADWRLRLLAICGPGTFLAYSLIPYKTPWCAISFLWPFFFTAGALLAELTTNLVLPIVRRAAYAVGTLLAAASAWWMVDLNYLHPSKDGLSYVYVQTFDDMWRITNPLLDFARDDPSQYTSLRGVILCGSTYPLPWVLGDFTGIGYYGDGNAPDDLRADFLLVQENRVAETESHLDDEYYKETLHLRPAQSALTLYLRSSLFKHYVAPDRQPEFEPTAAPEIPTETLPPTEPEPTPAE